MIKKENKTMNKQKLYNDFIQECYEFFERMSSKYIDIIEKDSPCIATKKGVREIVPKFNPIDYKIQSSPVMEVSIKFNVFKKDEKLKEK